MITYNRHILLTPSGKWYIPNRPYSISYATVPNGSFSGPSQAYGGQLVTVTATGSSSTYIKDYITVNGVQITGNTFIMPYGEVVISGAFKIDYNPLNLPPFTIRLVYKDGVTPTFSKGNATQVSSLPNVWDLTYNNTNWSDLLSYHSDLIEVLGANSTGIISMYNMFWGCSSLTSVSLFDTSLVTNMQNMFINCSSLTSVPLFNTSAVTKMTSMFELCTSLTTVPLFNTSSVTSMLQMFWGCSSLTSVPLFNTANVTNMYRMFMQCSSLTSVPLFNTANVTNMHRMFAYCSSLTIVPLFNTSKVTDVDFMLYFCTNVESGALALYNQMSSQTDPPSSHDRCFSNCGKDTTTGAAELAQIPSDWK